MMLLAATEFSPIWSLLTPPSLMMIWPLALVSSVTPSILRLLASSVPVTVAFSILRSRAVMFPSKVRSVPSNDSLSFRLNWPVLSR